MFIFNSYVSSFTSEYTKKVAIKKLMGEIDNKGFCVLEEKEDEPYRVVLKHKKSSLTLRCAISEKVDGALVFARMEPSKAKKVLSVVISLLAIIGEIVLIVLSVLGYFHFSVPIWSFVAFAVIFRLIELSWAKLNCIKGYKLLGSILGYTPPKVTIFKVKKGNFQ